MEQLESLPNHQGTDWYENTVTENNTLAGSDEYTIVENKRNDRDHVFLRLNLQFSAKIEFHNTLQ